MPTDVTVEKIGDGVLIAVVADRVDDQSNALNTKANDIWLKHTNSKESSSAGVYFIDLSKITAETEASDEIEAILDLLEDTETLPVLLFVRVKDGKPYKVIGKIEGNAASSEIEKRYVRLLERPKRQKIILAILAVLIIAIAVYMRKKK